MLFLWPQPSPRDLHDLYEDSYHSHRVPTHRLHPLLWVVRSICLLPYRLRFGNETGTFPPLGQGRLLDIGCGTGEYLAAMAARGWECAGCDVSETAVRLARQQAPSARVYHGDITDLPFVPNSFEAVTLWHTLEHLREPLAALERVHELLVVGGRLVIAVPNVASLEARLFGKRWMEIDIPGHLFFFSEASLRALVSRAGFSVAAIRPQVHPSSVSDSIDFFWDDLFRVRRHRQRRSSYYATYPLTVVSYALGNRGCIELVATRR